MLINTDTQVTDPQCLPITSRINVLWWLWMNRKHFVQIRKVNIGKDNLYNDIKRTHILSKQYRIRLHKTLKVSVICLVLDELYCFASEMWCFIYFMCTALYCCYDLHSNVYVVYWSESPQSLWAWARGDSDVLPLSGRGDGVHHLDDAVQGGVSANGHVGATEVVVDGAHHAHDVQMGRLLGFRFRNRTCIKTNTANRDVTLIKRRI